MHRALAIPELVFRIVDMFVEVENTDETDGDGPYIVDRPALAACARTCQAFYLPAITALWKDRDLDIETVLLHCMPADLWEVRREISSSFYKRNVTGYLVLRRSIRHEDLDRLFVVAPLVNKLIFGRAANAFPRNVAKELTQESYLHLASVLPVGIFSRLRHLVWEDQSADLDYLPVFLSPSLKSLHLQYIKTSGPHLDIISSLPERCPDITQFSFMILPFNGFGFNNAKDVVRSRLARLARGWNLRGLATNITAYNSLSTLGQLPDLRSLWLTFENDPVAIPVFFQPGSFRFMRDIFLDRINMRTIIALLQSSTFHSLRSLILRGPVDATSGDWSVLLRAVRSAVVSPMSVESLSIDEGYCIAGATPHESTEAITDTDLIPLFDFHNLALLFLELPGGFDLQDATIDRMAKSLPRLKGLGLKSQHPPRSQRRLSLSVLAPLALHCPRLELARLDLDARGRSFPGTPPPTYQACSLESLDVGYSPITSSRAVAGYLSAWFPQLAAVGYDRDSDSSSLWVRVQKRLAAAQMAREVARLEDEGESRAAAMARLGLGDEENTVESSEEEEAE